MAEHQLKKLQYDNKDIVAEVANRDSSGNVISTTYVDKSNNQEISGQKDFNAIPRVWVNPVVVPTGYTQIDYIELSGTQYINTGIIANSNTYVEIDFDNTDIANNGAAIGARANASDFGTYVIWSCIAASSKIRFDYGGNNVFQTDTIQSGVKYSVVKNGVLNYINGAAQASNTPRTYTGTYPLWIGCINQAEEITFPLIGKIYSCKIAQNNGATISRNFIPCIRKSDSVVGLYDLVSETFFTNDGTGSFTPGPESIGHYETLLTSGNIPTKTSDLANDSGFITSAYHDSTKANQSSVDAINAKIPNAATSSNQLADKDFVNSSIQTSTATFRGTSAEGLTEEQFLAWANSLTKDLNDYCFWNTEDSLGNKQFKRYKYTGTQWLYEYTLNNSSFTAAQWAAINSGITANSWVDLTNAQEIDGQKDFKVTPRVYIPGSEIVVPEGYEQLDYIESTGTQHINTGITPNDSHKYEYEITTSDVTPTDSEVTIFGSRITGSTRSPLLYYYLNARLTMNFAGYSSTTTPTKNDPISVSMISTNTMKCIIDAVNKKASFYVNDIAYGEDVSYTGSINSGYATYLFANNSSGTPVEAERAATLRIHKYVLKIDNVVSQTFIPARHTVSGRVGMYDITNDIFYDNDASSEINFVAGNYVGPKYESLLTDANFAQVAFSGSYTDLTNKPTIPAVYNGILTIQKNGTTVQTFGANQSDNVTANISVPTKTSDITNDSGYIDNTYHDSTKENINNKTTSLSTGSTDEQYPSAKCVFEAIPTSISRTTSSKVNPTSVVTDVTTNGIGINVESSTILNTIANTSQLISASAIIDYVASRGKQLMTNGTFLLGNNYNFSSFTFDGTDTYHCSGCIKKSNMSTGTINDEFIPFTYDKTYTLSYALNPNLDFLGLNLNSFLPYLDQYDFDKQRIDDWCTNYRSGTLVQLTQDLNAGDTAVHVTDVSSFVALTSNGAKIQVWDYVNSVGFHWGPGTYTRHTIDMTNGTIDTTNNILNFATGKSYSGITLPAGTYISQNRGGGFAYIGSYVKPAANVWTAYSANVTASLIRQGCAFCKIGMLYNYSIPSKASTAAWDATITYPSGRLVVYNNSCYLSLVENTGVTPGSDELVWSGPKATTEELVTTKMSLIQFE